MPVRESSGSSIQSAGSRACIGRTGRKTSYQMTERCWARTCCPGSAARWQLFSNPSINNKARQVIGLRLLAPARAQLICIDAERTLGCGVPITPRLSQKLHQTLGAQEGAEFVNWMHQMDARASDVATHGDVAELRAELRADIAELRQEMRVGFVKIHEEMAHLEIRFERRFGDLIKWSFVFWVGAVGAIAALAGVLR